MLYFILLLVAAALAGVVAALITASSLWAWVSTGLSVLALLVLAADWFRRRSRGGSPDTQAADVDSEGVDSDGEVEPESDSAPSADDESADEEDSEDESEQVTPGESESVVAAALPQDAAGTDEIASPPDEPGLVATEEDTISADTTSLDGVAAEEAGDHESIIDAAESRADNESEPAGAGSVPEVEPTGSEDIRLLAGLKAEVLVVDEYPRYHLGACGWLTERQTIPISVSEARDLGFTPCVRCAPDASLLANHRKRRKKFRAPADR